MRDPTDAERGDFQRACAILARLAARGFELYVTPGTVHLMTGSSHGPGVAAQPQRENSVEFASVPGISGGDW